MATRKSLVIDYHGVTRDINAGKLFIDDRFAHIEDTGGIPEKNDEFSEQILEKISKSLDKANLILFVVSAQDGLTVQDHEICKMLRKLNVKIILLINKTDLSKKSQSVSDFYSLGIEDVYLISAKNNIGLEDLLEGISQNLDHDEIESKKIFRRISIIGKPNSGKSTLINTLLDEDRMITSNIAGTTLDAIEIPFTFKKNNFLLYDTAGIMRKSKTTSTIQKFSINSTLKTIQS